MKSDGDSSMAMPVMDKIWKKLRRAADVTAVRGLDKRVRDDLLIIKKSGLFDAEWYMRQYSDLASLGIDPHLHYLLHGAAEGRNPGPRFDTLYYLESYPDVAIAKMNPLVHFIKHGEKEERSPYFRGEASARPFNVISVPVVNSTPVVKLPGTGAGNKKATQEKSKSTLPVNKAKEVGSVSKTPFPSKSCKGNLESADEKGITGWAVDMSNPGASVDINLLVDGLHVFSLKTFRARPDVSRAGMDGKTAGFFIPFPPGLLTLGQKIEVRAGDVPLKNGSFFVKSTRQPGSNFLSDYLPAFQRGEILPVTVIVPVYNAWEATSRCLSSLSNNLIPGAEVLVMDDASTDERIPNLLAQYRNVPGFKVFRNSKNIGYTCNVNAAIEKCTGRDIVLLNSDTTVTKDWLRNLRYCAYSQLRVATVTALSDNSGAFSVPEFGKFNAGPSHLNSEDVGGVVRQSGLGIGMSVPTGNGFCMYIRRAALDEIGAFDHVKFPRGYGEENEFCMRAIYAGWGNLVCDKAYVLHQRSQSFQGEKVDLIAAGAMQVRREYPEYKTLITRFSDIEFSMMRARIRRNLDAASKDNILPRILYVISTQTGGTPQTNLDLMRAMRGRYDCWLLRSDSIRLTLYHLQNGELVECESRELSKGIEPYTHRSNEYDRIVIDMIYRRSIDLLHIRHVAWHGLGLAESAKALGIPVIFSVHDFYSVCYSVKLVNRDNQYCGVDLAGEKLNPLWPMHQIPEGFSARWRRSMSGFLGNCDKLITTTPSAVSIFSEAYPEQERKFSVIPHGRDFTGFLSVGTIPGEGERVRILVPGNISAEKGATIIERLAQLDVDGKFEFHFLGVAASELKGIGVHHGPYARDEFSERVRAIKPHIGFVLSIWPETYCHTLTEMWACGIPVFGIDLGAVGDRIRATGCGWLLKAGISADEVFSYIQEQLIDYAGFGSKLKAVKRWQENEGRSNTTANMASRYVEIYQSLLSSKK
ncbi:glycosyltransferase [Paraburkholderia sp. J63]|uniref:glycosyltransferase n=1 Tax=Paraburkholderia sp. J63 TaxID=2805434 RepID=UPI002ABE036E|nr:glycosyltransferase [Paraburkholderia sp. J63]